MVYAQLYWNWNGKDYTGQIKPVELLGTDGVVHLDGRRRGISLHNETKYRIAKHIKGRFITGYRLFKGRRYSDATPISDFVEVNGVDVIEEVAELEAMQISNKVRPALTTHFGYEPCCEVLAGKKGTITFCTQRRYTEHSHSD